MHLRLLASICETAEQLCISPLTIRSPLFHLYKNQSVKKRQFLCGCVWASFLPGCWHLSLAVSVWRPSRAKLNSCRSNRQIQNSFDTILGRDCMSVCFPKCQITPFKYFPESRRGHITGLTSSDSVEKTRLSVPLLTRCWLWGTLL